MRDRSDLQASRSKLLKKDAFGRTELIGEGAHTVVRRDARGASPALRWVARRLLAREARSLAVLKTEKRVPNLIQVEPGHLEREYIDGVPMQVGKPADLEYFRAASRLLRRLHRAGVVHNDLAKEPNFLLTADGGPAIIDFQLSWFAPRRGALFRLLAREDIRHLLKHKRTYCPDALTVRERAILDSPSWLARLWMNTGKPIYLFITRKLMGWQDREGAGDRV